MPNGTGPTGPVPTSPHPLADGPLPFGQVFDAGVRDYGEFACSRATYEWLRDGAMQKIDGLDVHLQVMDECVGGHNLLVKAWTA